MGLSFHVYKVVKFRKLRRRGEIVLQASSDNAGEDDGDDVGDGEGGDWFTFAHCIFNIAFFSTEMYLQSFGTIVKWPEDERRSGFLAFHTNQSSHPPPHPPTLETLRRAVDWSLWRPTSNPSKFTRLTHSGGGKQQTHASEGVREEGEDVDRHGDGGGHLHQPHVHGPRLWPPLLCQERLV